MTPQRGARRSIAAVVAAAIVAAACGGEGGDAATSSAASETISIVATTSVLGDAIAHAVNGCPASVTTLMGAGTDPHAFRASAREVAEARAADLLVVNGGGLETGLLSSIDSAADDGVPVFVALEHAEPVSFADGDDGDSLDPHFWHDPTRMVSVVNALSHDLATIDAPNAACYRRSFDAAADQLDALDAEIGDIVAGIPSQRRVLVTNHDAFGYFALRYGFEVVGTVLPSGTTLSEASAADLAELAATIESRRVPAIFVGRGVSDDLARALASEVGRDVVVVELLSGSIGDDGRTDSYSGMLRSNATRIFEALA